MPTPRGTRGASDTGAPPSGARPSIRGRSGDAPLGAPGSGATRGAERVPMAAHRTQRQPDARERFVLRPRLSASTRAIGSGLRSRRSWVRIPPGASQYSRMSSPSPRHMADLLERVRASLAGRYTIERELGRGGMATVYLAEDLKHHRKVAVKVLKPELAATLGEERFFREIHVAAQLQHPHILPLLDSGEADGFFYYVMPYVEGESLRERLAQHGELPVHDAVRILSEVVDALAHAHQHGVVHRDIKPDNILLSGRHALVMDFGVAKAVSEATGREQLTTAGVALGTPAYMAPEQAAADPHLDHRVDIYAVGVLAYELLTGRPPFVGLTPQEVLAAHVTQAPEPVERHRPALAPALSQVVMRCIAKRAADRWQTAEELLTQLEPLTTT